MKTTQQKYIFIKPKYACGECTELHEEIEEARACCQPEIDEVYLCPLCLIQHDTEDEAIECCGFDPDGPPPPPSKQELEAAGQMRLPI